jgi:hypothetical protein
MLARMLEKRLRGYKALGYTIPETETAAGSAGTQATLNDPADW